VKGFKLPSVEKMCPPDIVKPKPVSAERKTNDGRLESSAAKDKIRVAPQGRRKPTRHRTYTSPASATTPKTTAKTDIQKSEENIATKVRSGSVSKKKVEGGNHATEISSNIDNQFDSFISTLTDSVSITADTSTSKNKSNKSVNVNRKSKDISENIVACSFDSTAEKPPRSIEKFQIDYIPLKDESKNDTNRSRSRSRSGSRSNDQSNSRSRERSSSRGRSNDFSGNRSTSRSGERSADVSNEVSMEGSTERPPSISLADVIKTSPHIRRGNSFKTNTEDDGSLPDVALVKNDSEVAGTDSHRYDRFRKNRTPPSRESTDKNNVSKSMEDVSRLTRENLRRSGEFVLPRNSEIRENIITKQSADNDFEIVEHLKTSSRSRQSLSNEKYFGSNDIVKDSLINEASPGKPRKLKSGAILDSSHKTRPQSVTVRSCDASDIVSQISAARSFGDLRASPKVKDDRLNKSADHNDTTTAVRVKVKDVVPAGNVGDGVLEFRRMSLKKTEKSEELLPKTEDSDSVKNYEVAKTEESKNIHPAFHRISLRKVEKRDDYSGKVELIDEPPAAASEALPTNDSRGAVTDESHVPIIKGKFPFQSHDVKATEGTSTTNSSVVSVPSSDRHRPFSQVTPIPKTMTVKSKSPYNRRSVDIPNSEDAQVPAWITMARDKERQREEMAEKLNDTDPVENKNVDPVDDVKAETLVKPSALKSKPTILPKPTSPTSSSTSTTSPPLTSKKPAPLSQKPKSDQCLVCGKTAYVFERIEVNKNILHKSCAKCHVCSRTLSLGGVFVNEGNVWCKTHR